MGTNYDEGTGTLDFQILRDKIDQLEVMAGGPASGVSFANSGTDLTSENVQDAISEIKGLLDAIVIPDPQDASEVEFTPGDTGLSATDVQAVIEEIKGLLDNLEGEIAGTLSAAEITFDDQNTEITAENVQAAVEALDTAIGDLEQPITIGNQFRIPLVNSGETDFTYSDDLQFDGDRLTTNDLRLTDQAAPAEETYKLVIDDQGDITSVEDTGGVPEIPDPLEVENLDVTTTADLTGVTIVELAAPNSETYMLTISDAGVVGSDEIPEGGGGVPDPLSVDDLTVNTSTTVSGVKVADLAPESGTKMVTIDDTGTLGTDDVPSLSLPNPLVVDDLDINVTADLKGVTIVELAAPSSETYMLTIDDSGVVSSDEVPSGGGGGGGAFMEYDHYTPSSNFTVGSGGSVYGAYWVSGVDEGGGIKNGFMQIDCEFYLGTSPDFSSVAGYITVSVPSGWYIHWEEIGVNAGYAPRYFVNTILYYEDTEGITKFGGYVFKVTSTEVGILFLEGSDPIGISSTSPVVWGEGDNINLDIIIPVTTVVPEE